MRWVFFTILFFLVIFFSVCVYAQNHVPPNTYVGKSLISFKSKNELLEFLAQIQDEPLTIRINKKIYRFDKHENGIYIDYSNTVRRAIPQSRFSFTQFIHSFTDQRLILPVIRFSPVFHAKMQALSTHYVSTGSATVLSNKLANDIIIRTGNTDPVPLPVRVVYPEENKLIETENVQKEKTADPIFVVLQRGDDTRSVVFQESMTIESLEKSLLGDTNDVRLDRDHFQNELKRITAERAVGGSPNYLLATTISVPNTNGAYASRYIEVDISQQKLFLWENTILVKTYPVSTGLYYPTPPGEYEILNKAQNAYSDIYRVWMPYWMAFYRDPKVNAYLGIHELPYWIDANGGEQRRPRNFIGAPHTGGCVSLDVGSAQEVYNWATVGTKVIIFE